MEYNIRDDYFGWLYYMMCEKRYGSISYRKLLRCLHDIEFKWLIDLDSNRAEDGIDLRYRYSYYNGLDTVPECLDGPCSVLEMIVALAIRCEDDIMENSEIGNRTGQWFWSMITNLGLGGMNDDRFDEEEVRDTIDRFLDRKYASNGRGGLFTIRNCDVNLRDVEIWTQMCWYLNNIV